MMAHRALDDRAVDSCQHGLAATRSNINTEYVGIHDTILCVPSGPACRPESCRYGRSSVVPQVKYLVRAAREALGVGSVDHDLGRDVAVSPSQQPTCDLKLLRRTMLLRQGGGSRLANVHRLARSPP